MKAIEKKPSLKIIVLLIGCIVLSICSLTLGYYSLSITDTLKALLFIQGDDLQAINIIHNIRLPRVLASLFIGASLAISGAAYQGMFRNPLVSPDILGVSSGSSVGASIAILLGQSFMVTQLLAFLFGFLTVIISYTVSIKSKLSQTVSLILTGTMVGSVCTSVVSMIKYTSDPTDTLPEITFWLLGSLSKIQTSSLLLSLAPMCIGATLLFISRWKLNVLMLEDDEAKTLGINITKWKLIVILASTLLTSAAVCLGGLIGWVGLMIPHIARFIFGSNNRYLIPSSAVLGSIFLLVIDTSIRTFFQSEVPIGVFTALLGAPFFIFLMRYKVGK